MDAFKEHIIGLQLDQKNIDNFNNLPAPLKGNFTKIYNSIFKSSIKASKKKTLVTSTATGDNFSLHKNFDAGEDCYEESSYNEEEVAKDDEEVVVEQVGKKKAAPKTAATTANTASAARGAARGARGGGRGGSSTTTVTKSAPSTTTTSFVRGRGKGK